MNKPLLYQLIGNAVLSLHVAVVLFVMFGFVFIIGDNLRSWRWVNVLWFRLAHLSAIAVVTVQAWGLDRCYLSGRVWPTISIDKNRIA